jgi:predicted PurR-regulated permease PerM
VNILTSYLIGLWLSVFLFYFWRRRIQRHIRQILESDTEFKVENLIKSNQDLSQNCKFVFLAWIIFGLGTQIYIFVIDGEFLKEMDKAENA